MGKNCGILKGKIDSVIVESGEVYAIVAHIGGLVGYSASGTITNSINKVIVKAQDEVSYTGGLCGFLDGGNLETRNNYILFSS